MEQYLIFKLQTMDKSIRMLPIFPMYFILNYNFSEAYPEVNSHPISIIFISIKTELVPWRLHF
jgi:hypothetical protein